MDTISESESEKIAKQQIESVENIIVKSNLKEPIASTIKNMLLSPSVTDAEKYAIRKILKNCIFLQDEDISHVNQYLDYLEEAENLRNDNNRKSENFSAKFVTGGESGSYKSPENVINAQFKLIEKAHFVCDMIGRKLGLIK
jgi:hypothetical protein